MLRVFPNPWSATDKDGVPCGVCPRDPESDGGGPGQFVGARLDSDATKVLQKLSEHEIRSPIQRTRYKFLGIAADDPELRSKLLAKDPIDLPVTRYYRDRIADGSLLAADAETARAGRVRNWSELTKPQPAAPPQLPQLSAEANEQLPPIPEQNYGPDSKAIESDPSKRRSKKSKTDSTENL